MKTQAGIFDPYIANIQLNSLQFTQPFLREAYFLVFGILEKLLIVLKTDISKALHSLAGPCSANTASLKTKQSHSCISFSSIHFLQYIANIKNTWLTSFGDPIPKYMIKRALLSQKEVNYGRNLPEISFCRPKSFEPC